LSRANPGRVAALRALIEVESGGHVEDLLSEFAPSGGPDRGLAWHLALGTLRWQGALDHVLAPYSKRPLERLDSAVLCVLRMGLFEARKSRTPDHAAVHQAVEAIKAIGLRRASGMVNAILRKASQQPLSEEPQHVLPGWLATRWGDHRDWIARIREPALVSVAGRPPEGVDVTAATIGETPIEGLWTLPSGIGSVTDLEGFHEGKFWVMDPAAARVADMVVASTKPGGRVLDTCAAPGGKAFRLVHAGLSVTATDRSPDRLDQMNENLHRLQMSIDMSVHDWSQSAMTSMGTFDTVLVDAPCTGLGIVRRHPEIMWRRSPGDVTANAIVQRLILRNAAEHVKPGGALVYAVCSTESEEGSEVVSDLEGWHVESSWSSAPPLGDEDGFQAFVLRQEVS